MKVNRVQLLNCLNIVKHGLASKEVVEQSTSFIFQDGQVISFNGHVAVHYPLPDNVDIEGAIPSKEILAFLTKVKKDEIDIETTENELIISSGKSKAGIKLEEKISLDISEINIPSKWIDLPKDFEEGIKHCWASAAKDMTNPILTAINLTNEFVCSTDDSRITIYDWKKKANFGKGVLLPAECVQGLLKADVTKYNINKNWIHFTNKDDVVFSCTTVGGNYPDLYEFVDFDEIGELEFPANMEEMLDCAGVFLSGTVDSDNSITININNRGILTVKGEGDYGWFEETCRCVFKGNETQFSLHPSHLQSILKSTRKAIIGEDKIKFNTDNFVHVVALEVP